MIEYALALSPPYQHYRAALRQLAGDVALRRGDLAGAADAAAAARAALGVGAYRHKGQYLIPQARLEIELPLAGGRAGDALAAAADAVGRPGDAMAAAADAVGRVDLAREPRYAWPLLAAGARAVTAARQAGRGNGALAARAADLLAGLRAAAERLPAYGPAQQANRLTFLAEAQRAESAGHAAEAAAARLRDAFDAAAGAWERLGQPYARADALRRGAEAALAAGDREGASQRLRQAADLADGIGARTLADQTRALARSARIRPGGPRDGPGPAAAAPLGLTAREFEVLRLVAEGRSNPEIAARLFISAKTASVHVSNILAKVGVASRGEAAAEAHRLHLFDAAAVS